MKITRLAILLSPVALLIGCLTDSGPAAQGGKSGTNSSSILAASSGLLASSSGNNDESLSSSEGSETHYSTINNRSSSSSLQGYSSISDGTSKKCYVKDIGGDGTYCVGYTNFSESDCLENDGQILNSCPTTGIVDQCESSDVEGYLTYIAYDENAAQMCDYIESELSSSSSEEYSSSSNYVQDQAIGCYLEDSDIGPLCVWTNTATQDDCTESEGTVKSACPAGSTQSCDYSQDDVIYKLYSYSEGISDLCGSSLEKRAKNLHLP